MRFNALLTALALATPIAGRAEIQYHLRLQPQSREFAVYINAKATKSETIFRIPAWSPGYYQIAHYEKEISNVDAKDSAGNLLPIIHSDPRAWIVEAPVGTSIQLSYHVLGDDAGLGFFGCMLGSQTGFINGASTFMYIDGRTTEADRLDAKLPEGWDIATGLDKDDGQYLASSGYDEFIDNPIQMGSFTRKKFTVEGIPFEAVYVSPAESVKCNMDRETERLRRVSAPAIQMFRGAGFKHYTYIIHLAVGSFSGGLEHRASTCIAVSNTNELNLDDLAAHENFHAWNVKQIRPMVLGPFDYTQQDRTGNLWWMEGVTDYYSKVLTYRSGLEDADWLLNEIREQFQELQASNERSKITLEDCSRQCWESGGFGVGDLSYYTKGFLVGAILDASIRAQTNGAKSLDDVMRLLFTKYKLPNPGVPEDGILAAINEVVGTTPYDDLYRRMLESTDELPYDILRNLGIEAMVPGHQYAVLGYDAVNNVVTSVTPEASDAGLKLGDKIVAVEETPWTGLADPPAGYTLEIERGGSRMKLEARYTLSQPRKTDMIWDPTAGDLALKLRKGWLQRPNGGVKEGD